MHESTRQILPSPEELKPALDLLTQIQNGLDTVLLGRKQLHRMVLAAILSRGHLLLEGLPGVGKTELVKTLGRLLGLGFKRVQFTPDLMPSDILGSHILQEGEAGRRQMHFEPGPVFTNLLLADEINRASPKTQSALLEAMQEQAVTLLGETRALPRPFLVLASQNPIDLEGTYPLPEAQLDRFMFKLRVDNLDEETMTQIIASRRRGEVPGGDQAVSPAQLNTLFAVMERIALPHAVARYIARLVAVTQSKRDQAPETLRRYIGFGGSPRAAIAIAEAARAWALLDGRPSVGFEDVRAVTPAILNHRLILNYQARVDGVDSFQLIETLLRLVPEAPVDLPAGMSIHES